MTARNWLSTELSAKLARENDLNVIAVTPDASDRDVGRGQGFTWVPLLKIRGASFGTRLRLIAGYLLHLIVVFRFNAVAGFRGAEQRLRQSRRLRRLAVRDGVPASRLFGWPFPKSRALLSFLKSCYVSKWQRFADVEKLFEEMQPALLVLGHVQNHFSTPYALAAIARDIPILGVIGSWDQPTTKGPLCPGISHYLAQSRAVAEDLQRYHGVPPKAVDVVGWPQMDIFVRRQPCPRTELLTALGLPTDTQYILLGSSPERLGHNEPRIARDLATMLAQQNKCALVIRAHPNDRIWRERFAALHCPPHVVVLPPELGQMDRLADQIHHAAVVLSPAGSILLDAVALDTPAVALAFENEDEPFDDRLARRYDMEHWSDLVSTEGVFLVRSQQQLEEAVLGSLQEGTLGSAGRARLRSSYLEPLDGKVADRIVAAIVKAAS